MNKNSKAEAGYRMVTGVVQIFVLVLLVLVVASGIGYFAIKNSQTRLPNGQIKTHQLNPSPSQIPLISPTSKETAIGEWDVVILGQVDACFVCQRGSPYASYTKVLAGKIPNGQNNGILAISGIAQHLLGEGGVPIYRSQQEEIVLLKKVKDKDLYIVVDVMKATQENFKSFEKPSNL